RARPLRYRMKRAHRQGAKSAKTGQEKTRRQADKQTGREDQPPSSFACFFLSGLGALGALAVPLLQETKMLRIEGVREFALAPAELWGRLSDARFLVQCIPDVESVQELAADRAALVLRPGFAFVRGTLDLTLQVVDAVEPTGARVILHSKGIGSTSDVEASLTLAPREGGGKRGHWGAGRE